MLDYYCRLRTDKYDNQFIKSLTFDLVIFRNMTKDCHTNIKYIFLRDKNPSVW